MAGSNAFADGSLAEALDRAIKNARHLRAVHAPLVKAARLLARKIDAWDVIVGWALEDASNGEGRPGRPAVPSNDNVSIASFLKYLDALGLTPDLAPAKGAPVAGGAAPRNDIEVMRERLRAG